MKKLYAKKSSSHLSISKKYFFSTKTFILLFAFLGMASVGVGQTVLLTENFSSITTGDNTTTSGSGTQWTGNTNFTSVTRAYQAGGAVRLGTSSLAGSITSKSLDLSTDGGKFTVEVDVKGWTNVEGDIIVSIPGMTSQTKTYSAKIGNSFEKLTFTFTGGASDKQVTIGTTAKRAFIGNVKITTVASSPSISLSNQNGLTFGTVCTNSTPIGSLKINGTNLTGNLSVTSNSAYTISTSSGGTYSTSLSLTPSGGTVSQVVYVKFTPTAASTYNGNIAVSGEGATTVNQAVTGTGQVPVTPSVSISSNPSGAICAGTSVQFTASSANLGGGTASYQWKLNGVNVGTNSTTYSNATLNNSDKITCVITIAGGCVTSANATSNEVTMVVNALPANPTGTISGTDYCGTTNLSFSNAQPSYYWQTAANGTEVGNKLNGTLAVSTSGNYYIRAYDGTCWSANSVGPYTVTINTLATINTDPTNQSAIVGGTATFSVAASNAASYLWQYYDGSDWIDLSNGASYSGVTTSSLTVTPSDITLNGTEYRCQIISTGACTEPVFSNEVTLTVTTGPIAAWDFTGESSPATSTPDVFNSFLSSSNLITRGTGAASSSGANSFRTIGFQNNGISTSNTDYFQITLAPSSGKVLSLSSIDANFNGTNSFAATPGVSSQFAYSLDGTNFTLIGSPQVTVGNTTPLTQIDLTGIAALQGVPYGTTITIRYYASGQTTTGGWGFYSASAGSYGLSIGGTISGCATSPTITSFSPTSGPVGTRVQIVGTGFTGANSLSINGVSNSNFTVIDDNLIDAKLTDVVTGKLEVTSNGCSGSSSSDFTVIKKNEDCGGSANYGSRSDLMISGVFHATSNETTNFVAIYNGTGSTINLSNYTLQIRTLGDNKGNGPGSTVKKSLTGTIAPNSYSVVMLYGSSFINDCDILVGSNTFAHSNFNGNDIIALVKGTTTIDSVPNPQALVIGGNDSAIKTGFTQVRKSSATGPTTTYNGSDWEIDLSFDCADVGHSEDILQITTNPVDNTILDCNTLNVSSTSTEGTPIYTWYYNDRTSMSGWSEASNLPSYQSNTLDVTNPIYYGYQFYASVKSSSSGTCIRPTQAVEYKFPTAPYYQSKGDGVWNDATMWEMSDNGISSFTNACKYPISLTSDNVLIQNDITLPINLEVKQLNISADKTLSNSADVILTITGNLTVNGKLNLKEDKVGTLVLSGKTDQTISGTGTDSINVWNVQLSNTNNAKVITNKELNVFGKMSFDTPSKLALGSGDVSLKSTANNTANLGPIVSSDAITYSGSGRFIVERYISSKAWHFLSVPTTGSTFKSAWQEGNDPGSGLESSKNNKPGYGTILTSPLGVSAGFDTISPQPSVKYFNNDSARYYPLSKTDSLMNFRGGYMVFIRGDRSVNPNYGNATTTTLRTRGELYTMVTQPTDSIFVGADSFALIGNPYPSAIDFSEIKVYGASNPVLETYYIWDPNLTSGEGATQYGLGAFRTISGSYSVPSSGNYQDGSIPFIQSGQAFFVYNDSETDSIKIVIPETVKVDGSTQTYKTGSHHSNASSTINDASLRSNLYRILNGQPPVLLDGTLTLFGASFNNEVNGSDASKLKNVNTENMSMRRNGKVLAIERRQLPEEVDTIFYKMNNYRIAPYRFAFIANKLDVSGKDAFLYDKYLQTYTAVSPNDTTWYDFTITSATGSWDENRFSIVFKNSKTTPVTLTNLKAYTKNKDIVVEWSVENESNMRSYTVESSTDGKTFIKGGTVAAKNVLATTYQWLDVNVNPGYHYYRILSTEMDGKTNYSKIVRVLVGNNSGNGKITIYPNPIKDGVINLQFENQEAGMYQLRLLNSIGQVMMNKTINHPGGSSSELLTLGSTITKGVYHLEIYKGSERVMSEKVVY